MILRFFLLAKKSDKTQSVWDPLQIVKDTSVNNNGELTGILSSVSGIISVVGLAGAIISLMAHALIVGLVHKNPEKWAELKNVIGSKLILVTLLSGMTSICAFVKYVFDQMI